jgi:hypothetical protein
MRLKDYLFETRFCFASRSVWNNLLVHLNRLSQLDREVSTTRERQWLGSLD